MMRLDPARLAIGGTALREPLTGIGHYTVELARALDRRLGGAPFIFYGGEWSRELRSVPPPFDVDLRNAIAARVPEAWRLARWLQQRAFSRGARDHRIALYHEPNFLAYRFAGPTVVTVHDLSWIRYPQTHPGERVRMMNAIVPRAVERAAQVIVDSEFVRGEVIEHFRIPSDRITAVPIGVGPAFHRRSPGDCESILRAHDIRYGSYVLAVGTLEPRKNLASVIRAFALLPESFRRSHPLVVAGASGWRHDDVSRQLERMVAAGEARITGYVSADALPALYSGAALFVYASLYEGFGLPPLEAMACGTPVVASRASSLHEVVGDAGVLVDPLDAQSIADAMRSVLENAALGSRLSAAGPIRAARFTWDRCAEETLAVYERATAG